MRPTRLDRGGHAAPARGRHPRVLRVGARIPGAAALAGHLVRHRRPGRRPLARRALGRLGELVGRPRGHPAPHRARPHAHRRDHRPRRHDVLARPGRRLPLGDELGGPRHRPRLDPLRGLPRDRRPRTGREMLGRPTGRPRSSPAATCRRSASWRRLASAASACPRSSRSSATTTSRSLAGSPLGSRPCTSPFAAWARRRPGSRSGSPTPPGGPRATPRMDLATSLVVRGSTAPPAAS